VRFIYCKYGKGVAKLPAVVDVFGTDSIPGPAFPGRSPLVAFRVDGCDILMK
jgi:hypothetical protein